MRERARERERGSGPARLLPSLCRASTRPSVPCLSPPPVLLDIPFYRHKEMAQLYNGGVAMCYVASGEVPGRYACPLEKCMSPVEAQLLALRESC
jgi:hypothetical protein